ncbi:putative zinc-binding metallopeptidase [Thiomicrospira microaerophila]|uniref:zinc-binding metallopeptidase family protein n=1 Tax=Thiomicrospira microaerophila TaxID=406020 RepID=UPI00200F0987|nr:putative zinc-binding metallopeptidase [Thiomicrospira microaerophila]UQB41738.1 putative zinc-binding metallopeptidase [Thiomicrospira microaerophila]
MKRFYCDCGQEVYFHNTHCEHCGRDLAFDPISMKLLCGHRELGRFISQDSQHRTQSYKTCVNHTEPLNCNWLLSADDPHSQCISCRTTQTIPDLSRPKNPLRWKKLEQAKRRLFYTLLSLGLDVRGRELDEQGLAFQFLEDQRTNPHVAIEHVLTGHVNGLITLNAAEADEGFLHTMKEAMNEPYRTLLGHFRHEVGHYYWMKLLSEEALVQFRRVFGDERFDYQRALSIYYQYGPARHWEVSFISGYATSHPFEDWAETWAHYLHITDTLDTAHAYGLTNYEPSRNDFDTWIAEWTRVTQLMNALNRSMGLADAYPFVLTPIILSKLRFIDQLIDSQAREQ